MVFTLNETFRLGAKRKKERKKEKERKSHTHVSYNENKVIY